MSNTITRRDTMRCLTTATVVSATAGSGIVARAPWRRRRWPACRRRASTEHGSAPSRLRPCSSPTPAGMSSSTWTDRKPKPAVARCWIAPPRIGCGSSGITSRSRRSGVSRRRRTASATCRSAGRERRRRVDTCAPRRRATRRGPSPYTAPALANSARRSAKVAPRRSSRSAISSPVIVRGGDTMNQCPYRPPDVGRE